MQSALVTRQYCSFATPEAYVLVSESFHGVSLYRVVKALTRLTNHRTIEVILAQLAIALQHVHVQGFMHRNIKVQWEYGSWVLFYPSNGWFLCSGRIGSAVPSISLRSRQASASTRRAKWNSPSSKSAKYVWEGSQLINWEYSTGEP